jgi:hypothetical protein
VEELALGRKDRLERDATAARVLEVDELLRVPTLLRRLAREVAAEAGERDLRFEASREFFLGEWRRGVRSSSWAAVVLDIIFSTNGIKEAAALTLSRSK